MSAQIDSLRLELSYLRAQQREARLNAGRAARTRPDRVRYELDQLAAEIEQVEQAIITLE